MKPSKYIISGGGTGGHIYPAIAIADGLKAQDPSAQIIFVGASGKMEMEKVPQAAYNIHGIWISGLQRKQLWRNILFPLKLGISLLQSLLIWVRYRPDVLIGTGGFASGPMLFMGNLMGSKTLLQEQNSYPGITNKLLAKKANAIAVAYPGMERFFPKEKISYTGNPLRSSLLQIEGLKDQALKHFGLSGNRKQLVILGGSLGAQRINELVATQLELFNSLDLDVIWQCGKLYFDRYQQLATDRIKIYPFIKEMNLLYSIADIIISRAGAASVSELCLVGKTTLLIPSPNVAENHQFHNANALVRQNAAILIEEKDLDQSFETVFRAVVESPKKQLELKKNIRLMAKPEATKEIIKIINNL
ncbi:MAG: undecaprenyldiphospho-muramoylpentapeptide beta-N-acetylglucosaminyltransferase [Flavobacteriaceae bacterium]|nr:undecaprenyldiphospho-muramoylpentapeptide beta-N-acetylglucosaminyltransferase [Flavobacteriaceae bacterium]